MHWIQFLHQKLMSVTAWKRTEGVSARISKQSVWYNYSYIQILRTDNLGNDDGITRSNYCLSRCAFINEAHYM